MSEVKVNKVSPRSGTTVTIGDSGDTINLVGTLQNNGSPLAGDISSVVAGTGLSGGATSGVATLNIEAAQPTITSLGTITGFTSTGIDDNADSLAMTIGSTEQIGIGSTGFDQDAKLTIALSGSGGANPSSISANTIATFRRTGGTSHVANISVLGGSSGASILNLGDRDDEDVGRIVYEHSSNYMAFTTGASERMRLTSTGLGIGTSAPTTPLEVNGVVRVNEASGVSNGTIIIDALATGNPNLAFQQAGTYKGYIHYLDSSDTICLNDGSGNGLHYSPTLQRLGVGTSSPETKLHVYSASSGASAHVNGDDLFIENSGACGITIGSGSTSVGTINFADSSAQYDGFIEYNHSNRSMRFATAVSEAMRIDSSGNVGIGTSSPTYPLQVYKATAGNIVRLGSARTLDISNSDNGVYLGAIWDRDINSAGGIHTWSIEGNERMRIDSSGKVLLNRTSTAENTIMDIKHTSYGLVLDADPASGTKYHVMFSRNGGTRGNITSTSSAVQYNTTSDYRLKENVSYDFDATTRIKQLKPARFNFIADADTTVDGFIAHEVSSIVPEAVTGTKDAVKEDGTADYQGIDQSKLVPLLVKTIQELEARITTLENA